MSHTPAPWIIDIGQVDKEFLKGRLQEAVFSNGEVVAICGDNCANAKLIAAAPELLEALKDMMHYAMMSESWQDDEGQPYIDKARAAINKAKGK